MELLEKRYKKTEAGVIPDDWKLIKLTEVSNLITDGAHLSPPTSFQGLPIATVENITQGFINLDTCRIISVKDFESLVRNNCKPQKGDVLLSKDGTIGITFTIKQDINVVLLSSIAIIRPNKDLLDSIFLSNSLKSQWFYLYLDRVKSGSALKRIVLRDIKSYYFPVPPTLTEQKAIADALSDVDDLIANLEKLITKKKAIKQGAMQQLLTPPHKGGKRLEGFSGEWEEVNLAEKVWYQEGPGVRKHQFTNSGVKLLNGTNINKSKLDLTTTDKFISNHEAYGAYKHFLVDEGDILIACSGISIDKFEEKVTIANLEHLPLCMNTSTMRFKMKDHSIFKNYFYHYLKSVTFKKQIGGQATGSAQLNFGPSHVNKVLMYLPPENEQKAISCILTDMEEVLISLEVRLQKYNQVKQGMMQELLTGKTRLI